MLRRWGTRRDGGAGLAEYAGLVVLAALILGALVALGVPGKLQSGIGTQICEIFQNGDCGKTQSNDQPGGDQPGDDPGGQDPGGQNPNGDEPSLGDLQKQADDAQKAADGADSKYGNIKQQIIDLLKDFIGITDIEECLTKGSISSCLWAAFDVGSWIFAALKIGKFAKAVKNAIKLWKEYNKGRKIIDRAKDAAKRAKDLLNKRRRECGLPVPAGYSIPRGSPPGVVRASYADAHASYAALALAQAKPKKGRCTPNNGDDKPEPPKNERTLPEKKKLATDLGYQRTNELTKSGQPVYKAPKGSDGPKYISPDRDAHSGGDFKGADSPGDLNSKSTRSGTYRYEDGKLVRIGD